MGSAMPPTGALLQPFGDLMEGAEEEVAGSLHQSGFSEKWGEDLYLLRSRRSFRPALSKYACRSRSDIRRVLSGERKHLPAGSPSVGGGVAGDGCSHRGENRERTVAPLGKKE